MDCLSQNIFKLFSTVVGNPSQVYQNNEGSSSQGLGLLYFNEYLLPTRTKRCTSVSVNALLGVLYKAQVYHKGISTKYSWRLNA